MSCARILAMAILASAAPAAAQQTTTVPNPFLRDGAPAAAAPSPATPEPALATPRARSRPATAAGLDAAHARCGTDAVVWGNPASQVIHPEGGRHFGRTRRGEYLCRAAALRDGWREAHP